MKGTHVLNHQTIEGLYALKLPAMAAGLAEQAASAAHQALSFEERLGLLVDRELTEREGRRLERYLKTAKLRTNAVIEDVDFRRRRGLERAAMLGLAESGWADRYGPERLEAACKRALAIRAHSYRSVESILRTGLDKTPLPAAAPAPAHPDHDNLRGPGYYR